MSKKQKHSEENAIVVKDIRKTFQLPHEQHSGIKQILLGLTKKGRKKGYENQKVLKGVSFEIKKGEFFGIVGRNGSGKSTMLKLLAGIYSPDSGEITVNGSLIPFIELGVGFNPELTGRENIFLNGALLGFSRDEMDVMYDDIVEFAELKKFMDQKLKNYSSGMQVRLAFSIAIRANADILLLDEVLAVGDEAFQRKCFAYFAELKRNKKTVILVTHSMDSVQRFCDRAILIDKGHKTEIGSPLEIAQIYRELNDDDNVTVNKKKETTKDTEPTKEVDLGTRYVQANVDFKNKGDNLEFHLQVKPKQDLEDPIVALEIFRDNGEQIFRWVTDERLDYPVKLMKNKSFSLDITLQNIFPVGIFSVRALVRRRDRSADYGVFNDIAKFEIKNKTKYKHNVLWKPQEEVSVKVEDE